MTTEEGKIEAEKILNKYKIQSIDGVLVKPDEEWCKKIELDMFMQYLGLSYSVGSNIGKESEEDVIRMKRMSGEMNVLRTLMQFLENKYYLEEREIWKKYQ